MKNILFICTGNTCRSPMAEGMFRELAQRAGLDVKVRSAGVSAVNGLPISGHASMILQEKGIGGAFYSRELSPTLIRWADLILTMTMNHKRQVVQQYPEAVGKSHTLKEYAGSDPAAAQAVKDHEQLVTELALKQALSQEPTAEERKRLAELERALPDFDVADPFGGPLDAYQQCADEIEALLIRLVERLRNDADKGSEAQ